MDFNQPTKCIRTTGTTLLLLFIHFPPLHKPTHYIPFKHQLAINSLIANNNESSNKRVGAATREPPTTSNGFQAPNMLHLPSFISSSLLLWWPWDQRHMDNSIRAIHWCWSQVLNQLGTLLIGWDRCLKLYEVWSQPHQRSTRSRHGVALNGSLLHHLLFHLVYGTWRVHPSFAEVGFDSTSTNNNHYKNISHQQYGEIDLHHGRQSCAR